MKTQLEKTLQSWFNAATFTGGVKVNCAVTEILKDKSAVIKMDPSPGAIFALLIMKSLVCFMFR